jgi:hypothetical protein
MLLFRVVECQLTSNPHWPTGEGNVMSDVAYQAIYVSISPEQMTAAEQLVMHYLRSVIGYACIPSHASPFLGTAVSLVKKIANLKVVRLSLQHFRFQ